ncbi:MAG: glycosyltransferase [Mariprofundaceae bacterium]|nr:glycosyltransferase [Mariprofundaceae bacterium]
MNHKQPSSIAIIISTYNAHDYLRMTLNGYAHQSDKNFSIYIADDGSDHQVADIITAFREKSDIPIHHAWHEDKGYRRAKIINQAIQLVQEPYIVLTDADCIPFPDMIASHRKVAEQGCFLIGSRILLSKNISSMISQENDWHPDLTLWQWISWRFQAYINRLFPLLLPVSTSPENQKLAGIRGCHFAFWKQDALTINGLDGSYEGWGREDSDFAARLFHAGIKRKNLRGKPVLHLWHAEASRQKLDNNDQLLTSCLDEKRQRAIKGIQENILEKDQNQ